MKHIRQSMLGLLMFSVLVVASGFSTSAMFATCTGADPCHACKNCRYCGHCAKNGGTCGVCKSRARH
jgi:hypothetical protein